MVRTSICASIRTLVLTTCARAVRSFLYNALAHQYVAYTIILLRSKVYDDTQIMQQF